MARYGKKSKEEALEQINNKKQELITKFNRLFWVNIVCEVTHLFRQVSDLSK